MLVRATRAKLFSRADQQSVAIRSESWKLCEWAGRRDLPTYPVARITGDYAWYKPAGPILTVCTSPEGTNPYMAGAPRGARQTSRAGDHCEVPGRTACRYSTIYFLDPACPHRLIGMTYMYVEQRVGPRYLQLAFESIESLNSLEVSFWQKDNVTR